MRNITYDKIYEAVEEGKTLVFPNQTIADSFVHSYVRENPGKAVFKDRFISWDTFRNNCCNAGKASRKATVEDRLIFVNSFIRDNPLFYFSSPDFPESSLMFASEIAKGLPYFKNVLENNGNLPLSMVDDMISLSNRYREFMNRAGLYEEKWLEPDFENRKEVLVFPSGINDIDITKAKTLQVIDAEYEPVEVSCFDNTLNEIRYVLRTVRGLLKNGEHAYDIVISYGSDSVLPYLKSEAYKYGVDLIITSGKPLCSYNSVGLFPLIRDVKNENFSLGSVKKLLLNPSFPFCDKEVVQSVIRKGIDFKIRDGGNDGSVWLYKLSGFENESRFFKNLVSFVNSINRADTVDQLRKSVLGFQENFFEGGSFGEYLNKDELGAFASAMDCMDRMEETAVKAGLKSIEGLFNLYLSVLNSKVYVPQKKKEGVRVYKYPLSCGLAVKHHFCLGLDDSSTVVSRSVAPFLDDKQDISNEVLKTLCFSSSGLNLSFARETYSGAVAAPSVFEEMHLVKEADSCTADEYNAENSMWGGCDIRMQCSPIQQKRYQQASKTLKSMLQKPIFSADVNLSELSASKIEPYEKCPFKWMCTYCFNLKDENFSEVSEDARETGIILHNTLEEFFTKVGRYADFSMRENIEVLEEILIKNFEKYSKKKESPDAVQLERLKLKYIDLLPGIASCGKLEVLKNAGMPEMEKEFSFVFEQLEIVGRIDCLMRTTEGKSVLLDFKKGAFPDSDIQLAIYAMALEDKPAAAAFYSIEKKKFKEAWSDQETMETLIHDAEKRISDVISGIRKGAFHTDPSDENCMYCAFRRVCRRRYVVR